MEQKRVVQVNGLSKLYQKRKTKEIVKAIEGVTFDVYEGEILGLLGPNGAGKTTTIKCMCGLLKPDEGSVQIKGTNVEKSRLKALNHISAVLEGNRNLYWRLTVRENLEYFAGNRGARRKDVQTRIDHLLDQFNLKHKENELVSSLSRGMQQKLAIAVALLANTEVILLDEPTLGIDVETGYEIRELLKEIVKKENKTIIISSHDMPVVQDLCERTVIINHGKVITNEKVDNLIDLFETKAYCLSLGEELNEKQLQQIETHFPIYEYSNQKLEVTLENDGDIYYLMDILKSASTIIEKIDRTTIDFEQVFMNLISREENEYVVSSSN
ncbi:ABC transporter ATP-binding protein [Alkalibacillus haloalkaliphilus]|uniref:Daunorubicin resistance protein DrrA family ABC transporter ATP-binding protein n=1 Tax=Alkalibacillus haloalkaliphilus TaxID=94136 RepID=A0A511W722_9BACI|nr:ABC transporter ATP-binding protein [Alkalibacillus haloalkaliphilus]GEN46836.1 daunorubicin resistance protein DrrA family ABC transporter ATP-binding protein [Alkalibacillus haloalkaliphilus]